MSHLSGTQQEDAATIQEGAKPLAHRKLLKQKLMDLFVKKKLCDESQPIPEIPIDSLQNSPNKTRCKWETISYKELDDMLQQSHTTCSYGFLQQ